MEPDDKSSAGCCSCSATVPLKLGCCAPPHFSHVTRAEHKQNANSVTPTSRMKIKSFGHARISNCQKRYLDVSSSKSNPGLQSKFCSFKEIKLDSLISIEFVYFFQATKKNPSDFTLPVFKVPLKRG